MALINLQWVGAASDPGSQNRVEDCDSRDATMMRQVQADESYFEGCRMVCEGISHVTSGVKRLL